VSPQAFVYYYAGESEVGAIFTSSSGCSEVLRFLESDMTFGSLFLAFLVAVEWVRILPACFRSLIPQSPIKILKVPWSSNKLSHELTKRY
jgi:hypothetical protein